MSSEKCTQILGLYPSSASITTSSIKFYGKHSQLIRQCSYSASTATSRTSFSHFRYYVSDTDSRHQLAAQKSQPSLRSKFSTGTYDDRAAIDSDSIHLTAYNKTDPLTPVSRSQSPAPLLQPQQPQPQLQYFLNSYCAHPRYRRESTDLLARCTAPEQPMFFTEQTVERQPLLPSHKKTYDIRSQSNFSTKNIEIRQDGRAIFLVRLKDSWRGEAPMLTIEVPPPLLPTEGGGRVLATTKLQSIKSGFFVNVGDSEGRGNTPGELWPQVTYSSWNEKDYFFEYEGRSFSWRSPVRSLNSYFKGHHHTEDYELVDLDDRVVLAAYVKDRNWVALKRIAKIELFVELRIGLELMAVAAIMGVEERKRRRKRTRKMWRKEERYC